MIYTKEQTGLNFDEYIARLNKSGRMSELLLIVPTNRKVRSLKKLFISGAPDKTLSGLNLETFSTVTSRLLTEYKPFISLSPAAARAMIKQSAAEIEPVYFNHYAGDIPDGTLDRIRNVISEYKKHGMSPELLRKEAESLEKSEQLKALDIAAIYDNYLNKCSALEAFETGDVYKAVNNIDQLNFADLMQKLYIDVKTVLVTGFDELTEPEIKLLNQFTEVTGIKVYINFDYYQYNTEIFAHLEKVSIKLEQFGFEKIQDKTEATGNNVFEYLRGNLFKGNKSEQINMTDNIIVGKFNSRESEVENIAREVKLLITEQGVEPHSIGVVFNLVQNYTSLVKHTFTKFGIPINLTDRPSVNTSFPVISVFNLLEVLKTDYFHKHLFSALNSGFINLKGVNVFNLQKAAIDLKITSGKINWKQRLSKEISYLELNRADEFGADHKINNYKKALNDIIRVTELLEPFETELSPQQFFENIKLLVNKLGITDIIMEQHSQIEENIKAMTAFLEMVSEVVYLLKLEHGANKKFPLAFYYDTILSASASARYNVKEKPDYGVTVTSVNEIRGLQYDYLFVGGLSDGDFPTRYSPEIFFSGSFRKKEKTHITQERYHFYQTLGAWCKKLYLTLPQNEAGRELVESGFVSSLEAIVKTSEFDDSKFASHIFSSEEKQLAFSADENLLDDESIIKRIISDKKRLKETDVANEFSGILENAGEILNPDKQFSITQLELYAKCPFRYFLERIMHLELIEEPREDVEAYELGDILHTILFRFYSSLREKGITLKGCDENTAAEARIIILEIAGKVIDQSGLNSDASFLERERILGINDKGKNSVLLKFIEYERNEESDFFPEYFEVGFGSTDKKDTDTELGKFVPLKIGDVKLRGKIDRIDLDKNQKLFSIVDYKLSGRKPTMDDLEGGLSLQLPLYASAARELLKENGINNAHELIIYSLKPTEKDFGKTEVKLTRKRKDVDKTALINNQIEKTTSYIEEYVESIYKGKFNLTTIADYQNKACNYCGFESVCRRKEMKKE